MAKRFELWAGYADASIIGIAVAIIAIAYFFWR